MTNRIKVFVFNFEEYEPINNLYTYNNKKYTNIQFINFLKKSKIWFNSYFKEVLEWKNQHIRNI